MFSQTPESFLFSFYFSEMRGKSKIFYFLLEKSKTPSQILPCDALLERLLVPPFCLTLQFKAVVFKIFQIQAFVWNQHLVHIFCMIFLIINELTNAILCFFLKISNKICYYVLLQTIHDVINFKFIFDQPLKQWLTGRKRGEDGNTKI